jgi:predicted O-methyltransferase YrrM
MLPQVEWSELIPPNLRVAVREKDTGVDGNISAFELEIISKLVKLTRPRVLFEIGTFDGRTTLNLAAHSRPGARVYTLDLPRAGIDEAGLPLASHDRKYINKPQSGLRFRGTDVEHKITQLYGDSAAFDFRPYHAGVDFLFIDGSHSYHYVLNDSRRALEMVRGRGVILWHDYVSSGYVYWPGLVRALDELHASDPAFRGLKHIQGTALAVLQISTPWYAQWLRALTPGFLRPRDKAVSVPDKTISVRDSRQPVDLRAALDVIFRETRVKEGTRFAAQVTATNLGSAVWLPITAPQGPVRLGCHLLDPNGKQLDQDFARCILTPCMPEPILPGETRSLETEVPAPPKGRYILEFDLVAEGVCWFAHNGSQTVRIPVEVF